ncbi:MAG TPA: hypothetical protein VLG12_01650 [Candidatus Saccharimonadales bacterium]|nr:hypothetical protein [Candidatus Saccharimonadales bacterium]
MLAVISFINTISAQKINMWIAGFYQFLIINNFSAFVTFIVGLFAFIIYRLEKNDKEKSSAKIVLEEIRAIEKDVDRIKSAGNLIDIVPANLSTSGWNKNRHTIVKFLDYDEIVQLGQFFERAEVLKDVLSQWRNHYFSAMQEKSSIVLSQLVVLALEDPYPQTKRDKLREAFEKDNYWFEPFSYKEQLKKTLELMQAISTTTIGDKIKRVSSKSWYQ